MNRRRTPAKRYISIFLIIPFICILLPVTSVWAAHYIIDTQGAWSSPLTMDTNGDTLTIITTDSPLTSTEIRITAPSGSEVTITGQADTEYENLRITVPNTTSNLTINLNNFRMKSPDNAAGPGVTGITISDAAQVQINTTGVCSITGGSGTGGNYSAYSGKAIDAQNSDVTISGEITLLGGNSSAPMADLGEALVAKSLTIDEDTTLYATGGDNLTSGGGSPAVKVTDGSLHIKAGGVLEAKGGGINGGNRYGGDGIQVTGAVTVDAGGHIKATGGGGFESGTGLALSGGFGAEFNGTAEFYGGTSYATVVGLTSGKGVAVGSGSTVLINGDFTAVGGTGNVSRSPSGLEASDSDVYITGGKVNIESGATTTTGGMGLQAKHLVIDPGADVTIKGGNATTNNVTLAAVYCNEVTINGGNVNFIGGSSQMGTGGIALRISSEDMKINDGTVVIEGGYSGAAGGGTGLYIDSGDANIQGGTVTINGGYSENAAGSSGLRVFSGNVKISGGTITVSGGNGDVNDTGNIDGHGSHGIYADAGAVTIENRANVTVTGGDSGKDSGTVGGVGIRALNTSSGTVTISEDAGNVYVRGGMGGTEERASIMAAQVYIASGNVGSIIQENGVISFVLQNTPGGEDVHRLAVDTVPAVMDDTIIYSDVTSTALGNYTYQAPARDGGTASIWLPDGMQTIESNGYQQKQADINTDIQVTLEELIPVTFNSVTSDGVAGVETTTKLTLEFSADITGLDESYIVLSDNTGSAAVSGTLNRISTGIYELPVHNIVQGDITVTITGPAAYYIQGNGRTVDVYVSAGDLPYVSVISPAENTAYNTPQTVELQLVPGATPSNITEAWYTVSQNVTEAVYSQGNPEWSDFFSIPSYDSTTSSAALTITTEGKNYIHWYVEDDATVSNQSRTGFFEIDTVSPDLGTPTASALSSSSINLNITASDSGSGIASMQWRYSSSASGPFTDITGGVLDTYTHTGLSAATTYYYQFRATDFAGNTSESSIVSATTSSSSGGSSSGGARSSSSSSKKTAKIIINCVDEDGNVLKELTLSETVGSSINIQAPEIEGYRLIDKAIQSYTVKSSGNTVEFQYEKIEAIEDEPETEIIVHNAYISGYPDGTFRPDSTVTRGEAAAMLYNLIDNSISAASYAPDFSDVATDAWYYNAVMELARRGILSGYPDGSFNPDATVTRAEFTVMALNLAGIQPDIGAGGLFYDVSATHWAAGYINAARERGIITGYPDGSFGPDNTVTRAEAVMVLNQVSGRDGCSVTSGNAFSDVSAGYWAYEVILTAATEHEHEQ